MANQVRKSVEAANAELDALRLLLNSGPIAIYDGSQPASTGTAISGQNKLATCRFGAAAFGAASAGVVTANAITDEASAPLSGTAAWARLYKTDSTTAVIDCTVGTVGTDIILSSTSITATGRVSITAMTITAQRG